MQAVAMLSKGVQCATVPALPKKEPGLLLVFHFNNDELIVQYILPSLQGWGLSPSHQGRGGSLLLIAYSVVSLVIVF